MYHPGKVVAVLSAKDRNIVSSDNSVQATLRMWDENVLTMAVAPRLALKIREGDLVLVDYRPQEGLSVPVPRNVIVKILRGRTSEKMWMEYREVYDKRKKHESKESQAQQSYIG
jgi:ADP-ribose pyrophosphatase YjhB (NUDIX family)